MDAREKYSRISAGAEQACVATVSLALVQDLFRSLRAICSAADMARCLKQSGIVEELLDYPGARLTHDQLVRLYQEASAVSGDEMMGLWSRPIRAGTLKYLIRAVKDAPSIGVALYRFTRFWNLLLDDYQLQLTSDDQAMTIALIARSPGSSINRFGHALMLKLTHGVVSWLVGREVPVLKVGFAFARPAFADDYPVLFPAPVSFDQPCSMILLEAELGRTRGERNNAEMRLFLERAPRDWIFTARSEHAMQLRVRELLYADLGRTLEDVAGRLNLSSRTLMRRLQAEHQTFQSIKDGLRRDLAIRDLTASNISLGEIAFQLGFSSPAVFHRAFRQWTSLTPGAFREAQQSLREVRQG